MRFLSYVLCLIAVGSRALQTYRRAGNPVYPAVITGFLVSEVYERNDWANFKVQYTYEDQVIDALTIESTRLNKANIEKYKGKKVEIYVSSKNPYIVSIKGNHCLDFPCFLLMMIGLWGIWHF